MGGGKAKGEGMRRGRARQMWNLPVGRNVNLGLISESK